jgi:hypothetical protein
MLTMALEKNRKQIFITTSLRKAINMTNILFHEREDLPFHSIADPPIQFPIVTADIILSIIEKIIPYKTFPLSGYV